MSFSEAVKGELARVRPGRPCCALAELAGVARTAGSLHNLGGLSSLRISTEHAAVARKAYKLAKGLGVATVGVKRPLRLRKQMLYVVELPFPWDGDIPVRLGFKPEGDAPAPDKGCCQRAFMRGLFLGGGFIASPGRPHHWEVALENPGVAESVAGMLSARGIPARVARRKGRHIVYMKDGDTIGDWLAFVGAARSRLDLEEGRVIKGMRNQVNRVVNCDNANLSKQVEASMRQTRAIETLRDSVGLENLPPALREAAALRLEHPEATLAELGKLFEPPLGKSGANHRLKRLLDLASRQGRRPSRQGQQGPGGARQDEQEDGMDFGDGQGDEHDGRQR